MKKSLVVRERGSVSLTEDGQIIMDKVRPILESLDFLNFDTNAKSQLKGNIRLGAYESIAINCLPKLFKVIGALHPELRLDVQTSRTDSLVKAVRKGSLDVALVINAEGDNKLRADRIGHDELGLFVSNDLARSGKSLEELLKLGMATISSGPDGHPVYYKRFLKRLEAPVKTVITCDSFETIRNFAFQGVMVGLLPLKVAFRSPGLTKVWPLKNEDSEVSRHYISIVSRNTVDTEVTDLIKGEFARICDDAPQARAGL